MNDEIKDLITLIEQLEAIRAGHTITYEGLHKVTEVMKDFAWETINHHPINIRNESKELLMHVENKLMDWQLRSNEDDIITLSLGTVKNLLSYIKGEI